MSGSVGAYVAQVDRVLGAGQGLFATAVSRTDLAEGGRPAVPSAPPRSGLGSGVAGAATDYVRSWTAAGGATGALHDAAADAQSATERGRAGAGAVRDTARAQATAIAPAANSPAGIKLLVSSMDERLAAMQRQIDTTRAQNQLLAARLRQVAAAYQMATGGGGRPFAAMRTAGGGGGGPVGMGGPAMRALGALSGVPAAMNSLTGAAGGPRAAGMAARDVHGALPPGRAAERGLQKDTILVSRALSAAFPQITEIGGYRADALHWHPDGLALDVMIPGWQTAGGKALGDEVLAWVMANKHSLGVEHVIWRQAMHYDGSGGEPMEDRGSSTANHMNHLHIATRGGGYPRGGEVYRL